jgi:hypothetical protein
MAAARAGFILLALVSSEASPGAGSEPPAVGAPPAETLRAFETYIRSTEARIDATVRERDGFLWAETPERRDRLRAQKPVCEARNKTGDVKVTGGLIHHWIAAVFIRGAGVAQVLSALQDYEKHKIYYRPDIMDSRILERNGNDFQVRLRFLKRKVLTVVLDTDHQVRYEQLTGPDWRSRSYSTRVVEIAGAGGPQEYERPQSENHGYLWRLNSYWLFRQRDGGVYVECEAVSLSRGIPSAVSTLIRPVIQSLSRDVLATTMRGTRGRVLAIVEASPSTLAPTVR